MKKFIAILFILISFPCFVFAQEETKPLEIGLTFDWISKSQLQRDENIKQIQGTLFDTNTILRYEKKEFREKYSEFLKNKNYLTDYEEISHGKKEDTDKYYCGFFFKKMLVAYGIQYKKNMKNIYYYDAMGTLRWLDIYSCDYPKFPYWSYQYERNGKMVAAYYYISDADQYVFSPDKVFKGRWYKDKMYNKNAKVIMTRSNYGQAE